MILFLAEMLRNNKRLFWLGWKTKLRLWL